MTLDNCKQTPLLDLLRGVPRDARGEYEHGRTHHQFIPYGRLCHEAADLIEALQRAQVKPSPPDTCVYPDPAL